MVKGFIEILHTIFLLTQFLGFSTDVYRLSYHNYLKYIFDLKLVTMKTTFFQRDNKIYCRLYHKGVMARISTGISIEPGTKFTPSRQQFQGRTPEVGLLNAQLLRENMKLLELFNKYENIEQVKQEYNVPIARLEEEGDSYLLSHLYRKYLSKIITGEIKTRRNTQFKQSTIKTYENAIQVYEHFVSHHNTINLMDYDLTNKDLRQKKELAQRYTQHFEDFNNYMMRLQYSINTRSDMVSTLIFCVNYWTDQLFLQLPRLKKPSGYEPPIVTLPQEFVKDFIKDRHRFYDKFDDRNKFLWEVCATMLITSLRISDVLSLAPSDIQYVDGQAVLVKMNIKTGTETALPIPLELSERYAYNLNHYGRVFTLEITHPSYVRQFLRDFMRQYPEMHQNYSYTRCDYRGQMVSIHGKFYDLIHTHMLRKTAITLMIANGVSLDHVRFASGHSHNSQSIQRYVGFVEKRHKSEIKDYYSKLLS